MLHRPLLRYAATGLVWWVALGGGVGHAEPDHDRILFLHLALEGETVTLREQAVRPGSLKQPRRLSPWAEIVYELRTSSGEMLWRGAVGDPSLVSHDSVPGESGHYNRAVEGLGSARFVIRVPVLPDADNVVLYRQGLVAGVPGKTIGHILLDRSIISRKPGGTQLPQGVLYTLQETGLREERINLVIVGEAYTQLEESLFLEDADRTLTAIMSTQPFVEYVEHYNLYAIFVASAESGPDRPSENLYRDTYFNSYFREDRLVRFPWQDDDLLYDLVASVLPEYDSILMIINTFGLTERYGLSGYGFSGYSVFTSGRRDPSDPEAGIDEISSRSLAVHEFGHDFAGLGDEYVNLLDNPPNRDLPNATQETQRDLIKWSDWIEDDTPIPTPPEREYRRDVGLFEGANYRPTGWYRPQLNCIMRHFGSSNYFCAICREAILLAQYRLVSPTHSYSPPSKLVVLDGEDAEFGVQPSYTEGDVSIKWYVDGRMREQLVNKRSVSSASLRLTHRHEVKAEIRDLTSLVKTDPDGLLTDVVVWNVIAGLAADFDGDGVVGFSDFLEFAEAFGSDDEEYDLDGDGAVRFSDFLVFVRSYGRRG